MLAGRQALQGEGGGSEKKFFMCMDIKKIFFMEDSCACGPHISA